MQNQVGTTVNRIDADIGKVRDDADKSLKDLNAKLAKFEQTIS